MCGIMGYTGVLPAAPIIIKGLEKLEYRGYDSAGIGVFDNGKIKITKTVGSPGKLWDFYRTAGSATVGIGHTRWATHGAPTEINAHPHIGPVGLFAVVHNGIIENCDELKSQLENEGYSFKSDTDTEVIAYLLERGYHGDVKSAITDVLPKLKGSYALGILCSDYPDMIFCAKLSSPLFVGFDNDGGYLASDVTALAKSCGKIYKLGDSEIGIISKDGVKVFDVDGCRIRKTEVRVKEPEDSDGKGEYAHYMLKEIYQQPRAVADTLAEIIKDGKIKIPSLKLKAEKIRQINRIEFIACGSAYHAGLVGSYVAQKLIKIPAEAYIASEYRSKNPVPDENTLAVIISQSGETADTIAAMREAKKRNAVIVSIVNSELSTIAQESGGVILTKAGTETAVATTKAFSAQLAVIYALCIRLAHSAGKITKTERTELIAELEKLPQKIESTLQNCDYALREAKQLSKTGYVCFIGRGIDYCTAMEGALKLKEVSYAHCEAYAAGELKHGTISLIEQGTPVVAVTADSSVAAKTAANIKECKARGAKIICVTDNREYIGDADDTVICVPATHDLFACSTAVLPLQLIAYYTALEKGCSIDKPKNLAKSVTVE